MVLLPTEVRWRRIRWICESGWRERGMRAAMPTTVAARFDVSRAWVHRLIQRRRETGSLAPRKQTKFRGRVLAGEENRLATLITARPDATLAELRDALADDRGAQHAVAADRSLGVDLQKKRYTPTNNVDLTSPRPDGNGGDSQPLHDARQYVFLDECGVTTDLLRRYGRSPRGDAPSRITRRAVIGRRTRWSRRSARRADGAGRVRRADRQRDLPRLRRASAGAHAATAAMWSCSTTSPSTNNPRSARRSSRPARTSDSCRPTVPISIRSNMAFAKLKAFFRAARPRTFDQVCELIATALGSLHARRMRELRPALRLPRYYMKSKTASAVGRLMTDGG